MTLVIDASVVVATLVDSGRDGAWAEAQLMDQPLAAPELMLAEAINVLRRLERARLIATAQATACASQIISLDLELFPFAPMAERVWALRDRFTSYDASYVVLADSLGCELAALDPRLARGAAGLVRCRVPHGPPRPSDSRPSDR